MVRRGRGVYAKTRYTARAGCFRGPAAARQEKGLDPPGAPPLAVEYAGRRQNETDLEIKIKELLAAGARYVWVVRLVGPRRVEVHTPNAPMRLLSTTDTLEAPGILRNRIPVRALFDREEAHRVTLRNLLQREGYEDLEAVRREGIQEGEARGNIAGWLAAQADALLGILAVRGIDVDTHTRGRIRDCRDPEQLAVWLARAAVADSLEEVF
ncbi:MAG: hypothetical protein BECKG1743D_GA0114223_101364 [Candidatus Kentron sp. G]|nr:MAG: hypothetical protein BECKG1743F_GA0114225_101144 [Candidatus Kentron sp. G]VFM96883.1 MAG: hypothetical protein BECKG1743E_GA0114224_100965 [Candidatus Kentron sp. G]VFM99644.1 MAG: hypothetical protein BECKG1743D_GA0114223_101364 [Candidatus Kentron sp. G]